MTTTGTIAGFDANISPIVKRKEFSTFQSIYEYYIGNVKKTKNGFTVKYGDKDFKNENLNLLYEDFSEFIIRNNE